MNTRDLEKYMSENGFKAERHTRHGTFWSDGKTRLLIGNHKGSDQHALRNDFSLVKKAIKDRQGYAPSAEIGLTHRMNIPIQVMKPSVKAEDGAGASAAPRAGGDQAGINRTRSEQTQEEPMKLQVVEAVKPKPGITVRTMRRFTKDDMLRVYREIARLSQKGFDAEKICQVLNDSGFTMANGDRMDPKYVAGSLANMQTLAWQEQIRLWNLDDDTKAKERHQATLMRPITPNAVYQEQKPVPLPAPQRSARVLPQWVLAILTDPALIADEKIEMVLAIGKTS